WHEDPGAALVDRRPDGEGNSARGCHGVGGAQDAVGQVDPSERRTLDVEDLNQPGQSVVDARVEKLQRVAQESGRNSGQESLEAAPHVSTAVCCLKDIA